MHVLQTTAYKTKGGCELLARQLSASVSDAAPLFILAKKVFSSKSGIWGVEVALWSSYSSPSLSCVSCSFSVTRDDIMT